jgi:putative transposase
MGNTYSKIYIHVVFAVKYREAMIDPKWKEDLYKYITGIVQSEGSKLISINGVKDHIHVFIGYVPKGSLSDLVRQIKGSSSKYINDNGWCKTTFRWQEGYGAFSYGPSQIDQVVKYIQNQENHHKTISFDEEFKKNLTAYGIQFDPKYLPVNP